MARVRNGVNTAANGNGIVSQHEKFAQQLGALA
jgi:hypothetical protein